MGALGASAVIVHALPNRVDLAWEADPVPHSRAECGRPKAMVSQRSPLINVGPKVWGFARMAGVELTACQPGSLQFRAYRTAVENSPSRWEIYLNDWQLVSGLVGNEPQIVQVEIPEAGSLSLIFSNAYTGEIEQRRTLYFSQIKFVERARK